MALGRYVNIKSINSIELEEDVWRFPALFSISEGGRMSSNLLQKQPFQDEYWSFPLILANYASFSTEIGVVATCKVNKV